MAHQQLLQSLPERGSVRTNDDYYHDDDDDDDDDDEGGSWKVTLFLPHLLALFGTDVH